MSAACTRRPYRRFACRAAVLLAAAPLALMSLMWLPAAAGPAAAATLDAQCLGSFTRTFTPPVTTTTRTVTATSTDSYSTCLAGPTGTGITTTTLPLSCVNVTAGPAETETITWNDPGGDTSTIAWGPPVIAGQTVVFTGTVTAGLYQGATAAKVTSGTSYIGSVLPCLLGTPQSQTTGLIDSLTITG
jgi:hypothetical protein